MKPTGQEQILKDISRAAKKAVTAVLRKHGITNAGMYSREVIAAADMILYDASVVTSWERDGGRN